MSIIPGIANLSYPIQIRLEEDFYLTSAIQITCNTSFRLTYEWRMYNCSSTTCSTSMISNLDLVSTSNEYFLPARTLPLGLYQIELQVTMNATSTSTKQTRSTYLLITPSGLTVNLVPLGTSMISSGIGEQLNFNPGAYSIDLDDDTFNASVRGDHSLSFLT